MRPQQSLSVEALGSMLLMGAAGLIAIASGLLFLASPLFLWALSLETGREAWSALWAVAALFVLFFNITRAVEIMRHPKSNEFAKLLIVSLCAVAACPLWY